MSDVHLRAAERQFRTSGTFEDYCRYMSELRRSGRFPTITPTSGSAQGEYPAAVHALAPYILNTIPKHWRIPLSEDPLEKQNLEIKVIRQITKERQNAAALCLPPRGILSHFLIAIQSYLPTLNPLHCTCGGEVHGHSPDCEVSAGNGSIIEDYHRTMTDWCSQSYGYSLLDEFLVGGPSGLNERLDWNYQVYLGWERGVFSFRLSDFGPRHSIVAPGIARSEVSLQISADNHCQLSWEVKQSALDNQGWSTGEQISYSLAHRISHIPMLIEEYPVWV